MPSKATKAKREAAKRAREEEEAALRERLAAAAAVADEAAAAAAATDEAAAAAAPADETAMPMELDEATLAVLNPSTQEDEVGVGVATPPKHRKLQPSAGELTEGRRNLVHRVEQATPRGTHQAIAQYKVAAATPEGEEAEARERRLATERQRLHRAREDVKSSLEQQLEAERATLAEKAAQEKAVQARRAAYAMKLARRAGKEILWDDMAPSCCDAASEFGFMRGMWNQRDSGRGYDLVQPLVREEWWWPWDELPRTLKLAAVDLGYDRLAWQTETFEHSGQRFLDWEEVELYRDTDAGSVCSDSELISGHDEINGKFPNTFHMTMDTMDLLAQPSRRSYCQGAYAAYRPRCVHFARLAVRHWPSRYQIPPGMYCRHDWSFCRGRIRAL